MDAAFSESESAVFLERLVAQDPYANLDHSSRATTGRGADPLGDLTIPVDGKPAPFPVFIFSSLGLMRSGTFLKVRTGLATAGSAADVDWYLYRLVSVNLKMTGHYVSVYLDNGEIWLLDDDKHSKYYIYTYMVLTID